MKEGVLYFNPIIQDKQPSHLLGKASAFLPRLWETVIAHLLRHGPEDSRAARGPLVKPRAFFGPDLSSP